VGTFAVQIAKHLGARVTAVCSTTKVDMVRSIGADEVIDYTRHDFVQTERGYDVLFDNVGDRPWSQTRRVLTATGINVTITGPKYPVAGPFFRLISRKVASSFVGRRFTWFTARARIDDLEFVARLLDEGEIAAVIENTYPLEKTADALRYLGEGHALGKLVIVP
jgi:NADPH:quinone reductase-like Zn-dependent oxidoreductase